MDFPWETSLTPDVQMEHRKYNESVRKVLDEYKKEQDLRTDCNINNCLYLKPDGKCKGTAIIKNSKCTLFRNKNGNKEEWEIFKNQVEELINIIDNFEKVLTGVDSKKINYENKNERYKNWYPNFIFCEERTCGDCFAKHYLNGENKYCRWEGNFNILLEAHEKITDVLDEYLQIAKNQLE